MQLTLHATRRTSHGASCLVLAMSAWSLKTRRVPSRHCRDARVYGHATTGMHDICTPPPSPALLHVRVIGMDLGSSSLLCKGCRTSSTWWWRLCRRAWRTLHPRDESSSAGQPRCSASTSLSTVIRSTINNNHNNHIITIVIQNNNDDHKLKSS